MTGNRIKEWVLYDWQRRLTVLLTGLLLLQYVLWIQEEKLWLDETLVVVKYALLITCAVQLLTRLNPLLRLLLQAVLLVAMLSLHFDIHWLGRGVDSFAAVWGSLQEGFGQLLPFLWFVLATSAIYWFVLWCVKVKWRIYTIVVASVLCFAIRDSFSLLILWDQVAMVLFCGLFMIVIHHFGELKKKNPTGWAYLAEYPMTVSGPIVALVTLTVVVGMLAPDMRPILTDPYTAWKNFRGEMVITGGKGYLSPLLQIGESSSGYSRSDLYLGGGFDFDYSTVMTVNTTQRTYWRGESRALYTGRGWEMNEGERRAQMAGVTRGADLPHDPRVDDSLLETIEVVQTFSMASEASYPVLFAAQAAGKVELVDDSSPGKFSALLWAARQGELRWDERSRQSYPQLYSIVSHMPIIDEQGLREAPPQFPNKAQFQEYLQLTAGLPQRVRDLAADITSQAASPYDKVKLLEQYLSQNYAYTNKPDTSKGRSRDFVDRFLFEIKEGYCDYYSTALVVMVRSLDIPARWVKGYATGTNMDEEYDFGQPLELLDPTGAGDYTVRNADAHSWVEVYFHGWGWIPFEPTSGFALPTVVPEGEEIELPAVSGELPLTEEPGLLLHSPLMAASVAAVVAVPMLLWFAVTGLRLQSWNVRLWFRRQLPNGPNQRIVFEYEKLLRYAKRKGFLRLEHETVREMTGRWVERNKWLQKDLEALLAMFERAKYGKAAMSTEDAENVTRMVQRLREEM